MHDPRFKRTVEGNSQKPVPRFDSSAGNLRVVEIFSSIQGEGPHSGLPCLFVRLAGCNQQCPHCDTNYSEYTEMTVAELLSCVKLNRHPLVVLTGGEPFMQNIGPFIAKITDLGYHVQIETNGSVPPTEQYLGWVQGLNVDIVVSPKTPKVASYFNSHATAFKYPITGDETLVALPTSVLGNQTTSLAQPPVTMAPSDVYLMPEDGKYVRRAYKNMLNISRRFGYRCSTRLHKLLTVR